MTGLGAVYATHSLQKQAAQKPRHGVVQDAARYASQMHTRLQASYAGLMHMVMIMVFSRVVVHMHPRRALGL